MNKTQIFSLVSNTQIEMRALTLADESFIATGMKGDAKQRNATLQKLMGRCTVRIVSPGPYPWMKEGDSADWGRMLIGDQIDAMLSLRCLSYTDGNLLVVQRVGCSSCRSKNAFEVDLTKDLRRQILPESSAEAMRRESPLEMVVDGSRITFVLGTPGTRDMYEKLRKDHPGRDMACGFRSRILDVWGPDGQQINRRDILDWLDGNDGQSTSYSGLTSDQAEHIRDQFDAADAGVDLEVKASCPDCGEDVFFDVPFDTMFLPGKGIQKRKEIRRQT